MRSHSNPERAETGTPCHACGARLRIAGGAVAQALRFLALMIVCMLVGWSVGTFVVELSGFHYVNSAGLTKLNAPGFLLVILSVQVVLLAGFFRVMRIEAIAPKD